MPQYYEFSMYIFNIFSPQPFMATYLSSYNSPPLHYSRNERGTFMEGDMGNHLSITRSMLPSLFK